MEPCGANAATQLLLTVQFIRFHPIPTDGKQKAAPHTPPFSTTRLRGVSNGSLKALPPNINRHFEARNGQLQHTCCHPRIPDLPLNPTSDQLNLQRTHFHQRQPSRRNRDEKGDCRVVRASRQRTHTWTQHVAMERIHKWRPAIE